jgi:acetyltransferase-like isoleucine patch superfamily enzyme
LFNVLHSRIQRLIQTKLWGMEIHPTARIATTALIDRTWPRGVHIGPDCVVEDHAVVLTHDMTRGLHVDTRLNARVHLGARCIVMPGLTIGEDCVVAPGAVVTKDMEPNSFAIGNPATISVRQP